MIRAADDYEAIAAAIAKRKREREPEPVTLTLAEAASAQLAKLSRDRAEAMAAQPSTWGELTAEFHPTPAGFRRVGLAPCIGCGAEADETHHHACSRYTEEGGLRGLRGTADSDVNVLRVHHHPRRSATLLLRVLLRDTRCPDTAETRELCEHAGVSLEWFIAYHARS